MLEPRTLSIDASSNYSLNESYRTHILFNLQCIVRMIAAQPKIVSLKMKNMVFHLYPYASALIVQKLHRIIYCEHELAINVT